MKAWMIEKPDGTLQTWTVTHSRTSCIREYSTKEQWRQERKWGYRCVPVKITKMKEAAK